MKAGPLNKYMGQKVGFTGTQRGMTYEQKKAFRGLMDALVPTHLSHGDCVGADDEAAKIVDSLFPAGNVNRPVIVRHPPLNPRKRAHNSVFDEDRRHKDYFSRNRDIVEENDLLVGCPKYGYRESSGGTWYTIAYAEGKGKPRFVIWPDGKVTMPGEAIP